MDAKVITFTNSIPPPGTRERESSPIAVTRAEGGVLSEETAIRVRNASFRLAAGLLRNREDALDIAQETLLRFLVKIDHFDHSRPLIPWILRITYNLCMDHLRKKKIRNGYLRSGTSNRSQEVDGSPILDREYEENELKELLWQAVNRLDELYREVVILRDYNDLSYSEIAEILKIPRGTVMSRLHKARQRLTFSMLLNTSTREKKLDKGVER